MNVFLKYSSVYHELANALYTRMSLSIAYGPEHHAKKWNQYIEPKPQNLWRNINRDESEQCKLCQENASLYVYAMYTPFAYIACKRVSGRPQTSAKDYNLHIFIRSKLYFFVNFNQLLCMS